ncbi:MAG: LPS-assembly protein LptD, partial [Ignavibacteria bacterium]|nr:LPS-assembly protein LptD [Ignavibacteria bacterium]
MGVRRTILLMFLVVSPVSPQNQVHNDSLISRRDSTQLHLLRSPSDTLSSIKDTSSVTGIDTVVNYASADSISYSLSTKTMSLYTKGDLKYQKMELQSDHIDIDWNSSTMVARGVTDSTDSTGNKMRGLPIMKDGGEEYHGKELGYNFKSKKGRINVADTKIDQGYYHGEKIKKVGQDILFVADGRYTTCDQPEPHYYFSSPKMKVTPGDKVIAEPVYLYIADVPLFWLPLGVFPNKSGRRSGIIAPAIAEDATHGRLLRHIGYYFAMNDYMDLSLKTDLYTKGSWALYSNYRYNLRYYLNGSLSGEYKKFIEGESSDAGRKLSESYTLNFLHNQTIDPTTSLNVNFTFASSNAYQNTIDLNQALRQDITSNATLSKSWDEKNSTTLNVGRRQNLIDGSIYETLPSLSFSHSGSYPFRFSRTTSSDLTDLAWYEMISVSYGANLTNNRSKVNTKIGGLKTQINGRDTT